VVARLVARIPAHRRTGETLKILEMGAGTGGTTYVLAPLLAGLDIAVEYTFTDISPSMVANARRKFGKQYPFMRFAVHDIEKPPAEELRGQHLVLASNAIHATHSLVQSLAHVRSALRPDGFLMMLEMTEVVPFIDLIFGLLEGWWLFDDGRAHAIVTAEHWERELRAAGFGHVDWTDGSLPENRFQKVMIALASGAAQEKLPKPEPSTSTNTQNLPSSRSILNGDASQLPAVEREAETFIAKYTADWSTPALAQPASSSSNKETATAKPKTNGAIVILTGATGSLGAHLAAALASHPGVQTVVCLNRARNMPAEQRQHEAFASRGIVLSPSASAKLRVLATPDFAKPHLGLPDTEYDWLSANATHIVHNAWPMSGTRVLAAFEGQFRALRGLLDLARDMASRRPNDYESRVGFQLVSSIGVVGCSGEAVVRERRVPLTAALPVGYCQAKWVCERMLDETVHRFPERFRAAVVRPGQIAGSRTSGVWNPVEHFAFLVKSAQALRAWPDLEGVLQWVPVNDVAGAMVDLLAIPFPGQDSAVAGPAEADAYPVYHIDNPVGQPWKEMSPVLAEALGIPPDRIVPFRDWITLVRRAPLVAETENPAARLVDFLEHHFERMSCGGLILDTTLAQQHSRTMAELGPVSPDVARHFVAAWKSMGFLTS
jgi:thioester reductase-like protein/SAM-dependent methyltransferase